MFEASSRVLALALAQFDAGGLPTEQLTSGLQLGRAAATAPFCDWNEMSTLFERAEEAAGGPTQLAALCQAAIRDAMPEAVGLMQLAPDLASGSELINTYADSVFFAHIRYGTLRRSSSRSLELTVRIPQQRGFQDCQAFFYAMSGALRGAATFGDLPPATVTAQIQPFVAHYEVTLPVLQHHELNEGELGFRRALFTDWQLRLRALRGGVEEARQNEIRALESETFAALSAAVAAALASQERAALPVAAASAVRDTLGCRRVVFRRTTARSPRGLVLAQVGPPLKRLVSFEAELLDGVFVAAADVAKGSAAAAALARLTPWLSLVFGSEPPPGPARVASNGDWNAARLAELTLRWSLTVRQSEVAWLMIQGESNKGIGKLLECTEGTVELHVHAVLAKSGLANRTLLTKHFFDGE